MQAEPFSFKNRNGLTIKGEVWRHDAPRGLCFIHHGLSGQRRQPHIQTMARSALRHGLTVVLFDGTNSFGESEGQLIDATPTQHIQDLEDVIAWAGRQDFYQEPFVLMGHSLGGLSTLHYAQKYPERVAALAPTAAVISGQDWHQAYLDDDPDTYHAWKKAGKITRTSSMDPSKTGEQSWNLMEDARKYDMLEKANQINIPVLLVVGDKDKITRQRAQKTLYDRLKGPRELYVIEGSEHTFKEPHLDELSRIIDQWMKEILV